MQVLVADERAWVREALRLFLEEVSPSVSVGEVGDAEALFRCTAAEQPDLILLDAALPRQPRVGPLRHCVSTLRALHPPVYIIVLCGNREGTDKMRTSGADAWVSKADPPDRLLAALQQTAG